MMENMNTDTARPVRSKERYLILDVLRGLALFGICLANFPEFSLYSFLKGEVAAAMPTAGADRIARYLQYVFIDGKFYTLFSLLFGIGFSIIISNAIRKHVNGFSIFYRRMAMLLLIGFVHLMLIWSGDILMLYALLGLFLPLFRNVSNRGLLIASVIFLLLPIGIDTLVMVTGINPSAAVIRIQQHYCVRYGITDDNFAYWLRDADNYTDVFKFLIQGAFVRMQEFIDGNRAFKVMGLFLLGFYIGRNHFYARLEEKKKVLKQAAMWGSVIGFPVSLLYAWSAMNGHPWGLAGHSFLYTVSIYPLGMAYAAGISLCYLRNKEHRLFRWLAAPGRMALTNYIGQSVWGILIFYGFGFGLGADMGLVYVLLIATGVYVAEVMFSCCWLHYFQYGPLEWIWRMLTYGKWLPLRKTKMKMLKNRMKMILLILCTLFLVLLVGACGFLNQPRFGRLPQGERLRRIEHSPNYRDGAFQNQELTPITVSKKNRIAGFWDFLFGKKPDNLRPPTPIPAIKTDLQALESAEELLVWFGHSSYLLQTGGKRFLVDPVFYQAAPVSFINKPFPGAGIYSPGDMPDIDYLIITHDHWDHLDYKTVTELKNRIGMVICPLGVGEHFEYWGFDPNSLVELDWNEYAVLEDGFAIHCLPARHYSGRGLKANRSLWSSFLLQSPVQRIYIGGDSGYGSHFAQIGRRFPDISLAILENGQYNKEWPYIHSLPEDLSQEVKELRPKRVLTVHHSKYAMARHAWNEPLENARQLSRLDSVEVFSPIIGEVVSIRP